MTTDADEGKTGQEDPEEKDQQELEGKLDLMADGQELFSDATDDSDADDDPDPDASDGEPKDDDDDGPSSKETPADDKEKETPGDPRADEPEADPDAIPDLAEGESPKAEQFKNLRDITTKFKKERNESRGEIQALTQRIADLESGRAPGPEAGGQPPTAMASQQPSLSCAEVFDYLVKARAQDHDEVQMGQTNAEIERAARIALQVFEPKHVLEVLDAANTGIYGKYTDDVVEEARAALMESQVRSSVQGTEAGSRPTGTQLTPEMMGQRQASLARVYESQPALRDPHSDLTKRFGEKLSSFQKRELGTPDKPGPNYWRLQSDPNLPEWQLAKVMEELAAEDSAAPSEADAKLVAENKSLKSKIDKSRQPAASTGKQNSKSSGGSDGSAEKLEKKLDSMMAG